MTLRALIINSDPVFRRLLVQHIATGFDDPAVAELDPSAHGQLPADFQATGYDVVLLDDQPGAGAGLDWLKDLRRRTGFPPIVYLLSGAMEEAERLALDAGAYTCFSKRKISHARLIEALRAAQLLHRRLPEPSPVAEEAGPQSRFGDYTIRGYRFVQQLADGPISMVYLAESVKDDRQVALKVLRAPPDSASGASTFERFLREYEIAARLRHPNVVRIFDFGAGDDYAYIAMEYFPCGDLRARMKAGITPLEAATILRQMAEALQVLHAAGVLHRDLKPGNVMLREDGSVVLIDFGMSKQLQLDAAITGNGEIFGTPYYMSPEQGHGRETDARSDIYSLGVIFYEMLMRRKPYIAGTPMQVIYKHAHAPLPVLPTEFRRFEAILYNCIAKDPQRRYPTSEQLVDAVRELERDEAERLAQGY